MIISKDSRFTELLQSLPPHNAKQDLTLRKATKFGIAALRSTRPKRFADRMWIHAHFACRNLLQQNPATQKSLGNVPQLKKLSEPCWAHVASLSKHRHQTPDYFLFHESNRDRIAKKKGKQKPWSERRAAVNHRCPITSLKIIAVMNGRLS